MEEKSVLIVGNLLSGSVGNRAAGEEMAGRLAARGWTVWTTSTQPGKALRLLDMLYTCWRRRGAYRVAQVDVFSGLAFRWAEAVCALLRALGKPYVLVLRGGGLPSFAAHRPRRVERLLRPAEAVAAPSGYLVERMAGIRDDVQLAPNALEIADYPFRLRETARPRLVWVRSFHEIYRPSMAVAVLAVLARDFPDAELVMVGPDKGDGSLERAAATARRLGVAGRVTFAGLVPKRDMARWIDRGDIFLNTTAVDNTPVTVMEAMACGACVVTTDAGGIPWLLVHERDALITPVEDAAAMAAAVRRLVTEPGLAARLSSGARAAAQAWDWQMVLDAWERTLLSLGRGAPGVCAAGERSFQS